MNGPLASVDLAREGSRLTAIVRGEIDLSNASALRRDLAKAFEGVDDVILDLSEVDYLDSAGVALVFDLAGDARVRRARLSLVHPSPASAAGQALALSDVGSVVDRA